ncbi:6-hydroxymethylpterin diphosphokinase MptE-like protein [Desulforegula conservatrix]|uniref:6-hydroxymethylpterin diphosphokinase MptE-like protein n=1 Tax=Desulforegula conservatrix TaxID=153026 RepID=UPI000428C24B|nr:6-hydroxymethylpterin diphosphokinase MptE-like protein [Desulforegula conservatrix]
MDNNAIYEKNISVIQEKYPSLYTALTEKDHSDESLDIQIFRNKAGFPFASLHNRANGRSVIIHDADDPYAEASAIVDSIEINPGEVLFLMGMGLGYLPLEIVKREIPLLKLFIVEKSFKLFLEAINNLDLSALFEAEDVYFIMSDIGDIRSLIYAAQADVSLMFKGSRVTYFEPEREIFPEYFAYAGKEIHNQVHHVLVGLNTSRNIGPMFFENQMRNFTTTLKSANLGTVLDRWKGKAAIVIGAGPSLSDNLETLKKYRNRFAIIVVDTALPVLLKNGIKPDLVATVDFHYISFEKYRDVIDKTEDIPLVFASKGATMTLKPYRCPAKFFIAESFGIIGSFMKDWKYWVNFGDIEAVSHLALLSARISGADPIIFVGFDLAYLGLRSYADGTSLTLNINAETMVWVPDQNGVPVPTDIQMYGQRTIMEKQITESSVKFYNVSRGVAIKGAEPVDLEALLDIQPDLDEGFSDVLWKTWEEAPKPTIDVVLDYLKKNLKDIKTSEKKCEKGMVVSRKASKELEKNEKAMLLVYSPLVEKALDLYDEAIKRSEVYDNAVMFFQGTDMRLKVEESQLALDDKELTGVMKVASEMDFVHKAFKARKDALDRLSKIFKSLHSRLSAEKKLFVELDKKSSGKKRSEILVSLGESFLEYTDFVDAEKTFRQAIDEDRQNASAWTGLGKTLSALKRHKEALECHNAAVKISHGALVAVKNLDDEKKYPDNILDQAERYMNGRDPGIMGNVRENWAIRFCDEILGLYPENERAALIKKEAQEKVASGKRKQEELLPFLMEHYEVAIEKAEIISSEKPELAKKVFEILRKHHPENPRILLNLGLIYLGEEDLPKAKRCFIQARSLDPDAYAPKIHLAGVLSQEGNYAEALIHLEQAYVSAPENIAVFLLESIADLQFEAANFTSALSNYEKFFISFPERKDILTKIGNCYSELGLDEAASCAWELSGKTS